MPVVYAPKGTGINHYSSILFDDILSNYIGGEGIERLITNITISILADSGWYNVSKVPVDVS